MSSAESNNNPEPGAMPGLNALQIVKGLFLRIFSERISGLDEYYDPEVSTNPLSDEQIESMRNNLANFLSFEQNEETTVFNELSNAAKEYLENTVFSYINDNISHDHFRRTFARVVRVLWQIRLYLETILAEFPFAATWGDTISNDCINRIYAQYGPQLVSVILTRMRERRVQNINSEEEMYSIFEIAKYFADFDDDVWKNPYIQHILDDTSVFLEGFDLQPAGVDQFETLASTRVEKEVTLASSFGFNRNVRKEVFTQVYTAFSQKFEELVNDNPQESLRNHLRKCIRSTHFEQADADRFFKVLSIYGHGSMWNVKRDELKDEIVERGNSMIQTCRVPSNNWDMASLTVAVQNLSKYEKSVRDVFRMPTNRLPGLKNMLNNVLRSLFETMFRSDIGRKLPEEFLADFVEHIAMRTDATSGWQRTQVGHLQRIIRHLPDKDLFLSHIERRMRAHDPRNMERRNRTFLHALQAISRVTSVSHELIASVRRACDPRLSAGQWAQTRPDVVYSQYTMRTVPMANGVPMINLTDMDIDSLMLYTVSITKFCGQRHNVYIRMTRMQLEVFSFLFQYGKCSKDTIRELIARIGVFNNGNMVDMTADMVMESLEDVGLLSIEETDGSDFVDLASPTLTKPYMEVGPVDPELNPATTDIKFLIDIAIIEYLEQRNQCTSQELFEHLFDLRAASSYGLVRNRILKLSLRKFIVIEGLNISFVPFTQEED